MKHKNIKNVIITGASKGIGRSLAFIGAKAGWRLVLMARNIVQLEQISSEININGGEAYALQCDVASLESMKLAIDNAYLLLGNINLAILNAGISFPDFFENYSSEKLKRIFDVNVYGIAHGIECLLPYMKAQKGGVIAAVGSLAEARGFPGNSSYCASKAAAGILLEAARIELKNEGISVITIKPGFIDTDMTKNNRFNMPFLLSSDTAAEYIIKGIINGKSRISFPLPTAILSYLGKIIPEFFYRWILSFVKRPVIE
jgi:short-subunit dehydrogenase